MISGDDVGPPAGDPMDSRWLRASIIRKGVDGWTTTADRVVLGWGREAKAMSCPMSIGIVFPFLARPLEPEEGLEASGSGLVRQTVGRNEG
jgi:hypothetical protein